MKHIKGLIKNISLVNFFHLSMNQGVNVAVALVVTPYLFQTLGEEQYGLVSLGLTVILLLGILVNYGFGLNVPRRLALINQAKEAKENLINEVVFTRLFLSLVLIIVLLISTQSLGLFYGYSVILTFSMVQLINDAVYPMFILQGFDRLSWISKSNAIAKIMYLILVIWLVKSAEDAKWVNFILGGTGASVNVVLLLLVYKSESIKFQWVPFRRVKALLSENFQFFSSTIASYILINGGFILLRNFVNDAELGFYALAQRVSVLLRMIPVFITQSILQNATRLHKEDKVQFEAYLRKSSRNGLLATFCIGIAVAFSSDWIVRILAGEFIPLSSSLMTILCFLPFLGMFNVSNMIRILVADQKQILERAIWLTTILMLLLGLIGSYYFGSYGLAVSLVVAEIFNFWIHRYLLLRAKI